MIPLKLSPRPKLKRIKFLAPDYDIFVTLLSNKEGAQDIGEAVRKINKEWWHFPFRWSKLKEDDFPHLWRLVENLSLALLNKKRVFLHCAAGVDRTGLIALATLLSFGLDLFDAIKVIEELRPVTSWTIEQKIQIAQFISDEVNWIRETEKGILAEAYSRRFKELYPSCPGGGIRQTQGT